MSLGEVVKGLDDPLKLLTAALRTAPARQQTLRSSIDWSYQLLTPSEQRLLERLAVFDGGCTLEAAQLVGAVEDLPEAKVVELLDRLVAQSLLELTESDGETRYALFAPVRRYGLERLERRGEADVVYERHRNWCLGLVQPAATDVFDIDQQKRVGRDHANVRTALRRSTDSGAVSR